MRNEVNLTLPTAGKCVPTSTLGVGDTDSSSLIGQGGGLSPIDFAELKRQVTIRQVLDLLHWQPAGRHGPQLRGPCPVHRSSDQQSRSFSVNLEKNVFRCFKPACAVQGNQLDLYALAVGLPILQAAHQLCQRVGIPAPIVQQPRTEKRNP